MTVKEFYDKIGGDYEDVLSRLMSEDLIKKFSVKYLNDPSFSSLSNALDSGNADEAFRAAHTLKCVCQNLGYTKLYSSAFDITEALRDGSIPNDISPLFEAVRSDYDLVVDAIKRLD